MLESSCSIAVPLIDGDIVAGDDAYLRTKRAVYDIIHVTKIDFSDDNTGMVCFEFIRLEHSKGGGRKKLKRVRKEQTVGWPAVVGLRKYR